MLAQQPAQRGLGHNGGVLFDRRVRALGQAPQPAPLPRQIAIIVNPKARRASSALAEIVRQARELGLPAPTSLATTRSSPGRAQARQAIEAGADLVVVIGGDGTLREVAQVLAGTEVALGVIALGSGNVLAHNLHLAGRSTADQVSIALRGGQARLDVGWATLDGRAPEIFLTMAGIGRDARSVAHTKGGLKARLGPLAYGLAGLSEAVRGALAMRVQLDDQTPRNVLTWTVLAGITPAAPGGVLIHPEALADDGLLHVLEVPIRHPGQWLAVGWKGITHHRRPVAALRSRQARQLRVQPAQPQPVQLDGDVVADVHEMQVRTSPRALRVQLPVATKEK